MNIPRWLNISLQVTGALFIILIIYIITLYVLNIDSIVQKTGLELRQNDTTVVIDGFAGPSYMYGLEYNTINPMVENYKRISRSINSNGGASFTYQFWMKVEDPDQVNFQNLILFLKGDNRRFNLGRYKQEKDTKFALDKAYSPDFYVACPSISFGKTFKDFVVSFNTNNGVYKSITIDMDSQIQSVARKNLLSMLPVSWTLLTFILEDNYSVAESAENGIKLTLYVNDIPYWIESIKGDFLKQNDGNLYFLPNAQKTPDFMKIGNFKYFNYPLSQSEIKTTHQRGPPTYPAVKKDDVLGKPAYVSALNKVDVYG